MKRSFFFMIAFTLASCGNLGPYSLNDNEKTTAELGARDYADRSGSDFLACSGIDSEPDGYVTCEIRDRNTHEKQKLSCSYRNNAKGCKSK